MKLFYSSNCLSRGHPASGARMMMNNENETETGMINAVQMIAGCCNTAVEEVELIV